MNIFPKTPSEAATPRSDGAGGLDLSPVQEEVAPAEPVASPSVVEPHRPGLLPGDYGLSWGDLLLLAAQHHRWSDQVAAIRRHVGADISYRRAEDWLKRAQREAARV